MFWPKLFLFLILFEWGSTGDPLQAVLLDVPEQNDLQRLDGGGGGTKCNSSKVDGKNENKKFALNLKQPFLDMSIDHESNVFLLEEKSLLFLLHGNELYQVFISQAEKKIDFLGLLNEGLKQSDILGAQIISWKNYILLAVALAENIDIYQISLPNLNEENELFVREKQSFDLIQQLRMPGNFQKLYLVQPEEDKVLLIVITQFTKLYGKLRSFQWQESYFEPIEELTVPQLNYAQMIGSSPKYLITGRTIRAQDKTILNIYEIQKPTLNLRNIQTLTVGSKKVHTFTFRDRNYLVACSPKSKKKCNSFKMSDRQFHLYKERSEKEYALDKLKAGDSYLVGTRNEEVKVFSSQRLDCHLSFSSNISDLSSIYVFQNNRSENFFILHQKNTFKSLFRIVEVEIDRDNMARNDQSNLIDSDETSSNHQQHLFESTVAQLRSLLLKRRPAMEVFKSIANTFQPKMRHYQTKKPIKVGSGLIGIVKLIGSDLASPMQLLERVDLIRKSHLQKRFSREITLKNIKKVLPTSLKLDSLKIDNLIYKKPLPEGFFLDRPANSLPILSIRKPIRTKKIDTKRLLARNNYRRIRESSSGNSTLLKVSNLNVGSINGISWSEFYDSLFLRNRDKVIRGSLICQDSVKVTDLNSTLLNGLVVDNLFNLVSPQVISSNIIFDAFLAYDMQVDKINGLNFAEDVVFRGQDAFIETPVSMHKVSVAGDVIIDGPALNKRQIHQDDLQQHYTGKVIIEGSLTVRDMKRDLGDQTQIIVGNKTYSETELRENYLLNNTNQAFLKDVRFGNSRVSAPKLDSLYLSGHPVEEHLLNEPKQELKEPLYLVFMNTTVKGDILCKSYESKLKGLSKNVAYKGEVSNITGTKIFEQDLAVDGLWTLRLNKMPVSELILKSELNGEIHFKGNKSFEEIRVQEELTVEDNLEAEMLNNFNLKDLLNYDYHLDSLVVDHDLEVSNIVFHKINGISFDDVWLKFKIENDKLVLDKDLIVEGNVEFLKNLNVTFINDIDWNAYEKSLVKVNENAEIEGLKIFQDDLTITRHLRTPLVNNEDLSGVFSKVLRKSLPQIIKGEYTFENLIVSNIDVSIINGMPTAAFLDLRDEEVVVNSDLIVEEMNVLGNVEGNFTTRLPFENIDEKIQSLLARKWENIVVTNEASWPSQNLSLESQAQQDLFHYLYKNSVRTFGNQTISGNVYLQSLYITKMFTKDSFEPYRDIDFIAKDSLLKNSPAGQEIKAFKTFRKPVRALKASAAGHFDVDFVNYIDVLRLNASLYRVSSGEPIYGPLKFLQPLKIHNCSVEGLINGVHMSQLYHSSEDPAPPLKAKHLVIDDLRIGTINDMSLDYFLDNRVTKKGKPLEVFGHLAFENLKISKKANIQSLNGIPLDNLVYKNSNHLQAITGPKIIEGDLILRGPAHALKLNNQNLMDLYQQTIFKDRSYKVKDVFVERKPSFEKGLIVKEKLDQTYLSAKRESDKFQNSKNLDLLTNSVNNFDEENFSRESLVYLDYDLTKELSWQRPENATFLKSWSFDLNENSSINPLCERNHLFIHQSNEKDLYILEKVSSKSIKSFKPLLKVKIENFCKSNSKVKSKIALSSKEAKKFLDSKKLITKMETLEMKEDNHLLFLQTSNMEQDANEIRVFRIARNLSRIENLQIVHMGLGNFWKVITIDNKILLVASHLHKDFQGIKIYSLESSRKPFKELQRIGGEFDIIEFIHFSKLKKCHLVLSCRHCHEIKIFEAFPNEENFNFSFKENLKLFSHIDSLNSFVLGKNSPHHDGSQFMLVLSKNSKTNELFLIIFEYSEKWLQHTFGSLPNVSLAVPLLADDQSKPFIYNSEENILLLICGSEMKCSFVKAILG